MTITSIATIVGLTMKYSGSSDMDPVLLPTASTSMTLSNLTTVSGESNRNVHSREPDAKSYN